MIDRDIVNLFWQRSSIALEETEAKYGGYCYAIAYRIVQNSEDAEECVNDTWLSAWNAMPDKRPDRLAPFLGRIARNFALRRLVRQGAQKRGGGEALLAFDELDECISSGYALEEELEAKELGLAIRRFVAELPEKERFAFISRYWYMAGEKEIAGAVGLSRSGVNAMLRRTREKLKQFLEGEQLCVIRKN